MHRSIHVAQFEKSEYLDAVHRQIPNHGHPIEQMELPFEEILNDKMTTEFDDFFVVNA